MALITGGPTAAVAAATAGEFRGWHVVAAAIEIPAVARRLSA
ncbi:hypothetical protein [Nonomuraea terrae]|nr:hypothetical protein [Nonomuraea terrae]